MTDGFTLTTNVAIVKSWLRIHPRRGNTRVVTEEVVVEALREVYDPELHYNIYDLGLVYEIRVKNEGEVRILMTLTTPACPIGPMITSRYRRTSALSPALRTSMSSSHSTHPGAPTK